MAADRNLEEAVVDHMVVAGHTEAVDRMVPGRGEAGIRIEGVAGRIVVPREAGHIQDTAEGGTALVGPVEDTVAAH